MTESANSRETQLKNIWSAGQTVLGCSGIIAICTLAYLAIGWLLRPAKPGPDEIGFLYFKTLQEALFYCGLVGGIFFFLLLGRVKTNQGCALLCGLYLAGIALSAWWLYSRVTAVAFHDDVVELRYLWPRPAVRLNPQDIISIEDEQRVSSSEQGLLDYAMHLRTRQQHYVSFADADLDDIREVQKRVKEMQEKGRGP